MPDVKIDSANLKIMGADSSPVEKKPSDNFKDKLSFNRLDTPIEKLAEDDVNYLTETCLWPRKPFANSLPKALLLSLVPPFIKVCFEPLKHLRSAKFIKKGNKKITEALDIVNIV
jgi:hypothetical protein